MPEEVIDTVDEFGSPIGTGYGGDGSCPPEYHKCFTEDALDEWLSLNGMEYDSVTEVIQPMGDAEAVIDFTKDLLFLDIMTILNMAVPLAIFAVYGLTLYAGYKWVQKKFSC